MLFCHLVITVCACTFVTCTLINSINKIGQFSAAVTTVLNADIKTAAELYPSIERHGTDDSISDVVLLT